MASVFGVDFGTTYTSMAFASGTGRPERIPVEDYTGLTSPDRALMRTSVLLTEEPGGGDPQTLLVGQEARRTFASQGRLLENFKPLLARRMEQRLGLYRNRTETSWRWDGLAQAQFPLQRPYRVVVKEEGGAITHQEQPFTMADIRVATEAVFHHLARKGREFSGITTPDLLVIGVPAQANLAYRNRLIDIVLESNWLTDRRRIRLLPEPLAVALQYGLDLARSQTILVFDFGGGTLDLTITDVEAHGGSVRARPRIHKQYDVGGVDFDWLLLTGPITEKVPRWLEKAEIEHVKDLLQETRGVTLMESVEEVKQRLSYETEASLLFPYYGFDLVITREEFEATIQPHLAKIAQLVEVTLQEAGMGDDAIDHILLAGGSASIPAVQQILIERFGGRVRSEFVGSGTGTEGFALAAQKPELIKPIVEGTYSLWNPATARLHPVVEAGTDVAAVTGANGVTLSLRYRGRPDLVIFEGKDDSDENDLSGGALPIGRVQLPAANSGEEIEVELLFQPGTTGPRLALLNDGRWQELEFEPWHDLSDATVPILLPGDIVRYETNEFPNYRPAGIGVIAEIQRIDTGEGAKLAVGDTAAYVFTVNNPEGGSTVKVRADNKAWQTATLRPGRGEGAAVAHLGQLDYTPLPAVTDRYSLVTQKRENN